MIWVEDELNEIYAKNNKINVGESESPVDLKET